jgi:hypothetical protein
MTKSDTVFGRLLAPALALLMLSTAGLAAHDLTLEQTLDIAINRTSRGGMIGGRLEVARMNYHAKRINFYVPEISINGNLPTYAEDKSYRPYLNPYDKELFETTNLDFTSNIRLRQSLITGGTRDSPRSWGALSMRPAAAAFLTSRWRNHYCGHHRQSMICTIVATI